MDFEAPVREGFTAFATFVPKLLGALLILVIGYFIAKLVAKVVDRVLERVGFDRAVEKGGIKKALDKSSYDASDIVAKLVFFAIFIPVLSMAVGALGIQALEEPLAAFIALIPKIIVAIVLVVIGAMLAGAVKGFIENALGGLSYANILGTAAAVLILFGFVKAALDQVGIATDVTGPVLYAVLAAAAGVVIVGVGGGLIKPMQRRWDEWLDKAADEKDKIKNEAQSSDPAYPADPAPATATYPAGTYAGSDATATTHEQRPL
ncbi:MAG: mechanosensitive ion channel family protein [Actinomycetes bacterium]